MAKFIKFVDMTEEDKKKLSKQIGDTVVMMAERESIFSIAKKLDMSPEQLAYNLLELLNDVMFYVPKKIILKMLIFRK